MRHSNSGNPPSTVHGLLLNYCNTGRTTLNYNTANAIQLTTPVLLAHYALLHCATVRYWSVWYCVGGQTRDLAAVCGKQKVEHKVLHNDEQSIYKVLHDDEQSRKVAGQSRSQLTAGASNYCSVRSAVSQFTPAAHLSARKNHHVTVTDTSLNYAYIPL